MSSLLPRELGQLAERELFIHEFFHSIQGESSFAGQPCFFIRLTGCHLRCTWCDTEHAFFEGHQETVESCVAAAKEAGCPLVEVTGGEPLLQASVYPLLSELCDAGHQVLLETSGALPIDRVDARVHRIVDWKAPASGEAARNHAQIPASLRPPGPEQAGDELKLVLQDRGDYEWARSWLHKVRDENSEIGGGIPVHFACVSGRLSEKDLADWILADGLPVRLQIQLHKIIWSPEQRGV